MSAHRKLMISVGVIWLFNISGIIGIAIGYQDWFLPLTCLNLLIYLFLILWNNEFKKTLILALLIPFGIGMIVEFLGVNHGLIFGNYTYGKNLGIKIYGVPWVIGVNWAILTYCSAAIVRTIHHNVIVSSLLGAIAMVFLDVIIEVSAPRFDFWVFENNQVPLQNYIGWLITAWIAHLFFQQCVKVYRFRISLHIFIAILVFFSTFLFI